MRAAAQLPCQLWPSNGDGFVTGGEVRNFAPSFETEYDTVRTYHTITTTEL